MGYLSVILAAAAAWIFGAIWYGVIGKQWMAASGLTEETVNRKDPAPYIVSFIMALLVAGMTRHILVGSGVDTAGKGPADRAWFGGVRRITLDGDEHHVLQPQPCPHLDGLYVYCGWQRINRVGSDPVLNKNARRYPTGVS